MRVYALSQKLTSSLLRTQTLSGHRPEEGQGMEKLVLQLRLNCNNCKYEFCTDYPLWMQLWVKVTMGGLLTSFPHEQNVSLVKIPGLNIFQMQQ